MSASSASEYSDIEERANAITHGLGVVLGVVGLILLLIRAFDHQADTLTIASMAVYGSHEFSLMRTPVRFALGDHISEPHDEVSQVPTQGYVTIISIILYERGSRET